MTEYSYSLRTTLNRVRALLRTNALHRTWNRAPNQGIGPADLLREAASLRGRVEARLSRTPSGEAEAIAGLLPLPALTRDYPMVIADLAAAVRRGEITAEGIEAYMTAPEFGRRPLPPAAMQVPAPRLPVAPAGELETV